MHPDYFSISLAFTSLQGGQCNFFTFTFLTEILLFLYAKACTIHYDFKDVIYMRLRQGYENVEVFKITEAR